jgi:hypothetical protein
VRQLLVASSIPFLSEFPLLYAFLMSEVVCANDYAVDWSGQFGHWKRNYNSRKIVGV